MAQIIKLVHNLELGKLFVDAPYNPRFNSDLMTHQYTIGGESPWDDDRKVWVASPDYIEEVEEMCVFYFPNVSIVYTEE